MVHAVQLVESPIVNAPNYRLSLHKGHNLRSQFENIFFQYIVDFPIKDNLLTKDKMTVPKCPLFGDSSVIVVNM